MRDDLRIVPASQFAVPALVAAFNRSFAGYAVPMTQTIESLTAMIEGNDVRLSDSVVGLDPDGEPVGIGLLGVRPPAGWVAGMGIAPAWRGAGHGGALLAALIARSRALGLRVLRLEVLEQNEPAFRLYIRMGFVEQRPLLVFSGPLVLAATESAPTLDNAIVTVAPELALARYAALHRVPAPWQRDRASLAVGLARQSALGIVAEDGALRAAVLYRSIPGGVVVLDAGSAAPERETAAEQIVALLRAVVAQRPDVPVRAINVAPGDPLGDALSLLRCPVVMRQREMGLALEVGS